MRKTFVSFCKCAVLHYSRQFFIDSFLNIYLQLHKDKVPQVRLSFASSLVQIKPTLEHEMNLNIQIMEIMNELRQDKNRDVIEAIEQSEFKLLQQRKKGGSKEEEKIMLREDQDKAEAEAKLLTREARVRNAIHLMNTPYRKKKRGKRN
jgi:hypothetical protein